MNSRLLTVASLSVSYGNKIAVDNASLAVDGGECVALIGTNGVGKSSLLRTVAGLHRDADGKIEFLGINCIDKDAPYCVSAGMILCPEGRQLFPRMSVFENVSLGAYRRSITKAEIEEEFLSLERYFPILNTRRRQLTETLSGGEQQMVALARALMGKPKLLLLDEPSFGLAPILVEQLFRIIEQVVATGCSVLIAEQNIYATLNTATRAYLMESGSISESILTKEILNNPQILSQLLGTK